MSNLFIIVAASEGLHKEPHARWHSVQFETDAIAKAKELAIATGEPHEVYAMELIGASTIPKSAWFDHRPQPSAPKSLSAETNQMTFLEVGLKQLFIWDRSPELGPLLKLDGRFALDLDSKEHYIAADDDVTCTPREP